MQAKRFASFDANSDGSISKTEWDQHGADRQAKRAEWKAKRAAATPAAGDAEKGKRHGMRGHRGLRGGHHSMRGGHGMMMKADTDGDKAISKAEFRTAALPRSDAQPPTKYAQVTAHARHD